MSTHYFTLTERFLPCIDALMMTAHEFRVALSRLDMPQWKFAESIGYRQETVSRWARGHDPIPRVVELVATFLSKEQLEFPE